MSVGLFVYVVYFNILRPVGFVLFGFASIIFIWGIIEFIRDSESDNGRAKGKRNMIWGIVGMVIMVSVFGIINIIEGTIGVPQQSNGPFLPDNPPVITP
jgi:hypothetical protein